MMEKNNTVMKPGTIVAFRREEFAFLEETDEFPVKSSLPHSKVERIEKTHRVQLLGSQEDQHSTNNGCDFNRVEENSAEKKSHNVMVSRKRKSVIKHGMGGKRIKPIDVSEVKQEDTQHSKELKAYGAILKIFHLDSKTLSQDDCHLLNELQLELKITDDEHLLEIGRLSDLSDR